MTNPTPTPPPTARRPRLWTTGRRLACPAHVPTPGTDAWWAHPWRSMSPEEQEGFEAAAGRPPRCDACAALEAMAATDGADLGTGGAA